MRKLVKAGRFMFALALCVAACGARAVDTNAFFNQWFAAQTNLHTWSAEFTQTRSLKMLSQPLTTTGKVWFSAPDSFRWEVGNPTQTVAMRKANELVVIYPRLKRAERYALDSKAFGQWRDALALLDAGFPQSRAQLESHFEVRSLCETNGGYQLVLQPKSATARRFLNELELGFGANASSLKSIEVRFADGSRMRSDFNHAQIDPVLPPDIFDFKPDPTFTVVEPLGH